MRESSVKENSRFSWNSSEPIQYFSKHNFSSPASGRRCPIGQMRVVFQPFFTLTLALSRQRERGNSLFAKDFE